MFKRKKFKIILIIVAIIIGFGIINSFKSNSRGGLISTFTHSVVRSSGNYVGYHMMSSIFKGHKEEKYRNKEHIKKKYYDEDRSYSKY